LPGGRPELFALGMDGDDTRVIRVAPDDGASLFGTPMTSTLLMVEFTRDVFGIDVAAQATPRVFGLVRQAAELADFGPAGAPTYSPTADLQLRPITFDVEQDSLITFRQDTSEIDGKAARVQVHRFGDNGMPSVVQTLNDVGGVDAETGDFDGDGDDDFLTWTRDGCSTVPQGSCTQDEAWAFIG